MSDRLLNGWYNVSRTLDEDNVDPRQGLLKLFLYVYDTLCSMSWDATRAFTVPIFKVLRAILTTPDGDKSPLAFSCCSKTKTGTERSIPISIRDCGVLSSQPF